MLSICHKSFLSRQRNIFKLVVRTLISTDGKWVKIDGNERMPALLKEIEAHWKPIVNEEWKQILKDEVKSDNTRYVLSMFPYPSGSLHLGHIRIYTTSDALTRLSILRGCPVIHPMGFDSFGLPAENAALQHSINPNEWTKTNIVHMKEQLDQAGFQFQWRESTTDASYYKWTQWLFLQLFKEGLAYRGMGYVNWDPLDCTVLADEQVDEEGRSWRSGAKVQKRCHRQWFIKTNAFANDLYEGTDLNTHDGDWKMILATQRNWIGKPNGYLFYLKFEDSEDLLQIFTSHPELFLNEKAFIAISEEHWLARTGQLPQTIINPLNEIEMDIRVVTNVELPSSTQATILVMRESFEDEEKREKVLEACKLLKIGGYKTSSKYRDWLISRQRYWGTPIPIVLCDHCGPQGVMESDLPVQLPQLDDWQELRNFKTETISNPIRKLAPKEWLQTECPKCGSTDAIRETETCDTFFDSSWYYLRYASPPSDVAAFDAKAIRPTWCYVGGKEHASLHLLYARFMSHFLFDQEICTFREPFTNLLMQSVVKGNTYKVNGKYVSKDEAKQLSNVEVDFEKMSKSKGNGVDPNIMIQKYGSDALRWCILSEGNPESERLWKDDSEKEFAPTLIFLRRVWMTLEEFLEAKEQEKNGQIGNKVAMQVKISKLDESKKRKAEEELAKARNDCIRKIIYHFEKTYLTRTAITGLHELIGVMRKHARSDVCLTSEYEHCLSTLIILMSPLTPHFSSECWHSFLTKANHDATYFDSSKSVFLQKSPQIDENIPVKITFKDTRGKFYKDKMLEVERKKLYKWREKDVRKLLSGTEGIMKEDIMKIDIIKDVCVEVTIRYENKNIKQVNESE